jgi:DHA1 family bicyclomycin/chloramphenicol resistance-like MFS transporter
LEFRKPPLQPRGKRFALALASIALVGPLCVHVFLPVIPAVKASFGISEALAQLTFSVTLLGMAFATLVYGSLADRYGRRGVLLSGLCLFLIGSAISAFAPTISTLVLGRLVQAIGAGCGMTLVRTIARDAYGQERLVQALAYLTMFYTLGPMVAPLVGGMLVDLVGWRSVFAFALVAGAAITAGAYLAIPETRPASASAGPVGKTGTGILRTFLNLFAHLRFTAFVLQTGFCTATFIIVASASSSLMKEALGRPSAEFGLYFLLFPAGFLCGNLLTVRVGSRGTTETMVFAGSVLLIAAVAVQAGLLLCGFLTPLVLFVPGFFITMAQGISLPYGQAGAMGTVPQLAGTAAGVGVFVQNFCAGAFSQMLGVLADGTPVPMMATAALSASLGLIAGAVPFWHRRRGAAGSL